LNCSESLIDEISILNDLFEELTPEYWISDWPLTVIDYANNNLLAFILLSAIIFRQYTPGFSIISFRIR